MAAKVTLLSCLQKLPARKNVPGGVKLPFVNFRNQGKSPTFAKDLATLMEDYIDTSGTICDVARKDMEALAAHAKAVAIPKGSLVVECGGFNDSLFIITKGILRAFRSAEDPSLTLWFAFPGDVVVDVFCHCGGTKSPIGIEAETDVSAFVITKEQLEQACEASPRTANAVRHIFERHALEFEGNILSLCGCNDGMERYLSILKRHPELLQNVPLKKLASYLLVTPQSLSRIRANVK